MKILYVSSHDLVGQQFNGYVLQQELIKRGHQSDMYVLERTSEGPNVHQLGGKVGRTLNGISSKLERELSLHNVFPTLGSSLLHSPLFKSADIVHLQLLHSRQFISLLDLPAIAKHKKVVWTLHDPWITTGHCIHPLDCDRWLTGCGHCPDLSRPIPAKRDATALNWKIKNWVMHKTDLHLVVASEWMAERCCSSPILAHLPYSVIPFGIDTQVFNPEDRKAARSYFNIPDHADVIAFRWAPYFKLKGPEYIKKALEILPLNRETYVITMDAPSSYGLPDLQEKYRFIDLEWVEDRQKIALVLKAADVFLMPSLAESFGLMAVEAMACGTPAIVFEDTALQSVIHAPGAGVAVPSKNPEALANAIESILRDSGYRESLSKNALKVVQEHYTMDRYVQSHLELYGKMLRCWNLQ
ncbi:MAG: glycosyltransferase [Chloroflexota bacterium]